MWPTTFIGQAREAKNNADDPVFQCCHAVIFSDSNSRIATLSLESTYIGMHLTINDSKNLCILPCLCHLPGLLKIPPFCSNDFPRKSSISIVPGFQYLMTQVMRDKMSPGKSGAGETPGCRAHGSNSPKHPPNGGIMMGPWLELWKIVQYLELKKGSF